MRILRVTWLWLQLAGGLLAAVAICWLITQAAFHLRLLNVQTGSMRPTFRPGDALIMQKISGEPQVGSIVSYRSPRNPNELVTHRVVHVFPNVESFQTKGDKLSMPDPVVRDSLLAGHVVAVLPGMGRVLGWLQSWRGLVVCVYLPAAAIAISELRRYERSHNSKRLYRLNQSISGIIVR
jgi:signal peptidase I